MRAGGRGLTDGRGRFGLRRVLVSAQVALSLVLLVGALLFVRSLQKLMAVDAGFRAEGVIEVDLDLRRPQYAKERRPVVYRELLERIASAARRGIRGASGIHAGKRHPDGTRWRIPTTSRRSARRSTSNRVGPGYFQTMGTALVAGREFDSP